MIFCKSTSHPLANTRQQLKWYSAKTPFCCSSSIGGKPLQRWKWRRVSCSHLKSPLSASLKSTLSFCIASLGEGCKRIEFVLVHAVSMKYRIVLFFQEKISIFILFQGWMMTYHQWRWLGEWCQRGFHDWCWGLTMMMKITMNNDDEDNMNWWSYCLTDIFLPDEAVPPAKNSFSGQLEAISWNSVITSLLFDLTKTILPFLL